MSSLSNIAHDRIRDRVPDLSNHRNGSCKRRIHAHGISKKYDEECVYDNKASSAEDLTHSIGQSVY